MFCFPQAGAAALASGVPVPTVGKCPAGEIAAGSAVEPGCYLPCKSDSDCSKGACQELPYDMEGNKGCAASAHVPGTPAIMQPKGKPAASASATPSAKPTTSGRTAPISPPHL
jgi:hypothetical protein